MSKNTGKMGVDSVRLGGMSFDELPIAEAAQTKPQIQNVIDAEREEVEQEEILEVEVEEVAFTSEEIGKPDESEGRGVELSEESVQAVEGFSAGSWFDLKIDNEYRRSKLAARIVSTGKYIFVNRSGVKVAEFFTNEIAAAYQLGEIKVLDDEAMFDRALKAVISNLREMKAES